MAPLLWPPLQTHFCTLVSQPLHREAERVTPASRAPKEQRGDVPRAGRAASPRPRSAAQPGPPPSGRCSPVAPRRRRARCCFERCHVKIIICKAVPTLSRAWRAPRAPGTDAGPPGARTAGAKRQQRSVPGCAPLHRGFAVTHSAGPASVGPGRASEGGTAQRGICDPEKQLSQCHGAGEHRAAGPPSACRLASPDGPGAAAAEGFASHGYRALGRVLPAASPRDPDTGSDMRRARRRGSPLVRRILTVAAGLAEQLPASAAAPAAGRAGGEVRPGPSPPAQSGSAKFWCACPCPIGALPSTRDPSPPEGRARADGPGEAAPSLPVAERPAALRCRPALRRTLFPLPGVSPAIRNPEAVSPRSVSPPGRQQPGKSPQQQGQGCGRSLSRAAGKPRSGGRGRPHRRPVSQYHRLLHAPQPDARFRVYFLPPTWKMPARLLLTAPRRPAEPLPLSGGGGRGAAGWAAAGPFLLKFVTRVRRQRPQTRVCSTVRCFTRETGAPWGPDTALRKPSRVENFTAWGIAEQPPPTRGVTLLKFVTHPSPRGAAVVRPLPVRGRGERGAPSGRFCRRSRPASVRPSVRPSPPQRLSDPAHFAMCLHGVKAQEGAVLGGRGACADGARRAALGKEGGARPGLGGAEIAWPERSGRPDGLPGHSSAAPGTERSRLGARGSLRRGRKLRGPPRWLRGVWRGRGRCAPGGPAAEGDAEGDAGGPGAGRAGADGSAAGSGAGAAPAGRAGGAGGAAEAGRSSPRGQRRVRVVVPRPRKSRYAGY
nr:collagen alpha-1(I) chain-like [Taeniopygia guttata]